MGLPGLPIAFADAPAPTGAGGQLLLLVAIFGIFYFIAIAPMRKRQKALQQIVDNLKKGDRVVTTGGFYGEVVAIEGAKVVLKLAENVKVPVAKSAIAGREGEAEEGGRK